MKVVYEVTCPVCEDQQLPRSRVYTTQEELRSDGSIEVEYACDSGHEFRETWSPTSSVETTKLEE